jgi:ketosteroid isomerase-like protein
MPVELTPDQRRARNVANLENYYRLLAARDIDGWITLWAEGCEQMIPFASGDLPTTVTGRDKVYDLYKKMAAGYTSLRFSDIELHPMHNPDQVFARWTPYGELADGRVYTNNNVALFEFDGYGKITHFTEYFNPVDFRETFGEEKW